MRDILRQTSRISASALYRRKEIPNNIKSSASPTLKNSLTFACASAKRSLAAERSAERNALQDLI